MNRDLLICKRILMQFAQSGKFSTDDNVEAYHVALLKDRGYVEASIKPDEAGHPMSATIGRMTAIGHDAYENEFKVSPNDESYWPISRADYFKDLSETKKENELARDKMIYVISTGGIALSFAIVSYFHGHQIRIHYALWIVSIALWGFALAGRLISDCIGSKAIDKCLESFNVNNGEVASNPTVWDKLTDCLNLVNLVTAILGIGTFAWFIIISITEV